MKYRHTHASVLDDSPAMIVGLCFPRITLRNEDGLVWVDRPDQWRPISPVEEYLYADEDGIDMLIDGKHNVNFVPSVYSRFANLTDRDGNPMRAEIHPTGRHWYVEVQL